MKLISLLRRGAFSGPGLLVLLSIVIILLLSTALTVSRTNITTEASAQSKRKISFKNPIPKEIKVLRIDHVDDENWYETFEFEIKNVSDKNIVFIYFTIALPQFDRERREVAFVMVYGEPNAATVDAPSRKAILPGEKYTFKIDPKQVAHLIKGYSDGINVPPITALRFNLYNVWFSDRTGYVAGEPVTIRPDGSMPWVRPNGQSSASPPIPDTRKGRSLPTRVSLKAGSGLFLSGKVSARELIGGVRRVVMLLSMRPKVV